MFPFPFYFYIIYCLGINNTNKYNISCGTSATAFFENGFLFIDGKGAANCKFSNNIFITEVKISDDIEIIESFMFSGCANLRRVEFSKSLQTIPSHCFYNCHLSDIVLSFHKELAIKSYAFANNAIKTIHISGDFTNLYCHNNAFNNCNETTSLVIDSPKFTIFQTEDKLSFEKLVIPVNYVFKMNNIFFHQIVYTGDAKVFYKTIDLNTFKAITFLGSVECIDVSITQSIAYLSLPKNLEYISSSFLVVYTNNTIELPSSLKFCNQNFILQSAIENIIIKRGETNLFELVLSDVKSLSQAKTIILEDEHIQFISSYTFAHCNIVNFTFPKYIEFIPEGAFYSCKKLVKLSFSNSIHFIGRFAFSECDALNQIVFPTSINTIYNSAFSYCSNMINAELLCGITVIPQRLFECCYHLQSIIIPDKVTLICYRAFYNCNELNSITFPNSLHTIEKQSFANCARIQHFLILSQIDYIGPGAFSNCKSLSTFIYNGCEEPVHGNDIFRGCASLNEVQVQTCYKLSTFLGKPVISFQ